MTNEALAQLLTEKIDNSHKFYSDSIEDLKTDVKEIKVQTTKTNGKVRLLEFKEANCPIKEIEKNTAVLTFFVTHPKIFYFFCATIGIILGENLWSIIKTFI